MTLTKFCLALACFTLLGCAGSQDPSANTAGTEEALSKTDSGVATDPPEAVLDKFFLSLAESDAEAALSCTTGDKLSQQYVDTQVKLNRAFVMLGENAVQYFGEEGKKLQLPAPALSGREKVALVPVIVSGTKALWPSNPSSPMQLNLVDGKWKMDLAASFPTADSIRQANQTYGTITNYISDIAEQISAGKFMTIDEVRAEIKRRGAAVGR